MRQQGREIGANSRPIHVFPFGRIVLICTAVRSEGGKMPFIKASDLFGPAGMARTPQLAAKLSCAKCNVTIQESITGCRRFGDGSFACSDCFYDSLSNDLEAHPVAPRRLARRRG